MGDVIAFRRDLDKVLDDACRMGPDSTVEEVLARHRRVWGVFGELMGETDSSPARLETFERASSCGRTFHRIAKRAGVTDAVIAAFDERRLDHKSEREYRASLPDHLRM